jgi:hypothetical protein
MLRTNDLDIGTWILKTRGEHQAVLDCDATLQSLQDDWFVRETVGMLRRTLARLDVTSRSLFAVIDAQSCFAGTLLELALAADRSYMLDVEAGPRISLSELNFGPYETVARVSRLSARFYAEETPITRCREAIGRSLTAAEADALGLVTARPDELDWEDELRIALEERRTLSPDALTGMDDGNPRVWSPLSLAELDLYPTQRGGGNRRTESIRHRQQSQIQLGTRMTIDYQQKIPNNVDLASDKTLQRALEHWQPEFLNWWSDMGPEGSHKYDCYLRTATSVDQEGIGGASY